MTPEEIAKASKAGAKRLVAEMVTQGGPFCNFCGMNEAQMGHLVPGPAGVHICWQCADSALEVIKVFNANQK